MMGDSVKFLEYLDWCLSAARFELARFESEHIEGGIVENTRGEIFALERVRSRFLKDFPDIDVPSESVA